jgi:hypothetical protein
LPAPSPPRSAAESANSHRSLGSSVSTRTRASATRSTCARVWRRGCVFVRAGLTAWLRVCVRVGLCVGAFVRLFVHVRAYVRVRLCVCVCLFVVGRTATFEGSQRRRMVAVTPRRRSGGAGRVARACVCSARAARERARPPLEACAGSTLLVSADNKRASVFSFVSARSARRRQHRVCTCLDSSRTRQKLEALVFRKNSNDAHAPTRSLVPARSTSASGA